MRQPIQSEGVKRGIDRSAQIGVAGSVNPQFNWGGLLSGVAKTALPVLAGALG
jgi:hypothetical protein